MDRLSQLKQFALDDPDDPFNLYALALEYLKSNPAESGRLFESLIQRQPQYLPTYYPYAQWLIEQKNYGKAEQIFQQGIEAARIAGEQKTLKEMLAAYNDWKYDQ
jgi:predicted Zn-dependent protease